MTTNIDDFNIVVGKILAALFQKHPVPQDLSAEDFAPIGGPSAIPNDELEDQLDFVGFSARWLIDEHYVRCEATTIGSNGEMCFSSARLTEKGLATLTATPKALKEHNQKKSYGEELVDLTKAAGKTAISAAAKEAVGSAAKPATTAIAELVGTMIGSATRSFTS